MSVKKNFSATIIVAIICLLLFWGGAAILGSAPSAKMMLDNNEINLGNISGEGSISLAFQIRNAGDVPLQLTRNPDVIQVDGIEIEDEIEVAPGDIVPVKFTVQKEKLAGEFRIEIPYVSNDKNQPEIDLVIYGQRKGLDRFQMYGSQMHARLQRDF